MSSARIRLSLSSEDIPSSFLMKICFSMLLLLSQSEPVYAARKELFVSEEMAESTHFKLQYDTSYLPHFAGRITRDKHIKVYDEAQANYISAFNKSCKAEGNGLLNNMQVEVSVAEHQTLTDTFDKLLDEAIERECEERAYFLEAGVDPDKLMICCVFGIAFMGLCYACAHEINKNKRSITEMDITTLCESIAPPPTLIKPYRPPLFRAPRNNEDELKDELKDEHSITFSP